MYGHLRHRLVQGKLRHVKGWKPGHPGVLPFMELPYSKPVPKQADLSDGCPTVKDQGALGACSAHASLEAMSYLWLQKGIPDPNLSRLYTYYWSRVAEGTSPAEDSGCVLHDVARCLQVRGSCLEVSWPYSDAHTPGKGGPFSAMPPDGCDAEAKGYRLNEFRRVHGRYGLQQAIANLKLPVVAGFSVSEDMLSDACAQTGLVPVPTDETEFVGGHAVLFVGYDDDRKVVKFQNSWGSGWGDRGMGYLPYEFFRRELVADLMVFTTRV
jgi:C1A family cysteine protease